MAGVLRAVRTGGGAADHRRWLVVGATDRECGALVRDRARDGTPGGSGWPAVVFRDADIEVIVCGVGKASAGAATARALDPARHAGVVSIGVAGALPGSGLAIGDVVIATRMVLADEGSENPDGFADLSAMGFGPMPDGSVGGDAHAGVAAALGRALAGSRAGVIATVSTCSGTDARAAAVAHRTGAIAEAMEGAAVALAALRIGGPGFPVMEVRAISNTTGDRTRQRWDLAAGFAGLRSVGVVL